MSQETSPTGSNTADAGLQTPSIESVVESERLDETQVQVSETYALFAGL